ncbi:MAG TPA: cell division protein FtsB, partial [Chromatiales bacterium]|nr:cell division protein FtsB [Chromatiales bacterium]
LLLLLVPLQYRLWVGEGSFADVVRLRRAVVAQQAENHELAQRNAALDAEVSDLKHGLAAVAELARTQLGMIGKGETFYQVVDGGAKRRSRPPRDPPRSRP